MILNYLEKEINIGISFLMIKIYTSSDSKLSAYLVSAALSRSTRQSPIEIFYDTLNLQDSYISIFINPSACLINSIKDSSATGSKFVIFGSLPHQSFLDSCFRTQSCLTTAITHSRSSPASRGIPSESPLAISYRAHTLSPFIAHSYTRPFERFDFTYEWNNLGYGRINGENNRWGIASDIRMEQQHELASIDLHAKSIATYAALIDYTNFSILWFNREVGPLDSHEWVIVEDFLSQWRSHDLYCIPVISQIPFGYDSASTMRLDCDEDIVTSSYLLSIYQQHNIPFSLAIRTSLLSDQSNRNYLKAVVDEGVSILSHSVNHYENWGSCFEVAREEAYTSREDIYNVTGVYPSYAVSPFHHTPYYALDALSQVGYKGCIGGIINHSKHFLLARGGAIPSLSSTFVGHSQQCMLHGDCLTIGLDPISTYRRSFDLSKLSASIFGYLDHPFSSRYSYGWASESDRANVHLSLISYMCESSDNHLFLNENELLDFLLLISSVDVTSSANQYVVDIPTLPRHPAYTVCVNYKGEQYPLHGKVTLPI